MQILFELPRGDVHLSCVQLSLSLAPAGSCSPDRTRQSRAHRKEIRSAAAGERIVSANLRAGERTRRRSRDMLFRGRERRRRLVLYLPALEGQRRERGLLGKLGGGCLICSPLVRDFRFDFTRVVGWFWLRKVAPLVVGTMNFSLRNESRYGYEEKAFARKPGT